MARLGYHRSNGNREGGVGTLWNIVMPYGNDDRYRMRHPS